MNQELGQRLMSYAPILLLIVALVVMTIVPQRKRDKEVKEMMDNLKKGDLVKTIGGMHGRVVRVKPDVVTIETGPQHVELTFSRSAIATVGDADVEATGLSEQEISTATGERRGLLSGLFGKKKED